MSVINLGYWQKKIKPKVKLIRIFVGANQYIQIKIGKRKITRRFTVSEAELFLEGFYYSFDWMDKLIKEAKNE